MGSILLGRGNIWPRKRHGQGCIIEARQKVVRAAIRRSRSKGATHSVPGAPAVGPSPEPTWYAAMVIRSSSRTRRSSRPRSAQLMVTCRMSSSKVWAYSSSRMGQMPVSRACAHVQGSVPQGAPQAAVPKAPR